MQLSESLKDFPPLCAKIEDQLIGVLLTFWSTSMRKTQTDGKTQARFSRFMSQMVRNSKATLKEFQKATFDGTENLS